MFFVSYVSLYLLLFRIGPNSKRISPLTRKTLGQLSIFYEKARDSGRSTRLLESRISWLDATALLLVKDGDLLGQPFIVTTILCTKTEGI